eukprot:2249276-Prymnesium_polylepis.1
MLYAAEEDTPPLCRAVLQPPQQTGAHGDTPGKLAVRVVGLHAATKYEGFGVIACSTVNATSCAALHPAECSPPAKGAP